jgi:hypothetical protein
MMVIAIGNDGMDVGDASPADVNEAIAVGSMDVHDAVPSLAISGESSFPLPSAPRPLSQSLNPH